MNKKSLPPIEITSDKVLDDTVVFSSNGKHILCSGDGDVMVWRVQDGERVAIMHATWRILCLAVSKDGKWIAAGTDMGRVYVWDSSTYEESFMLENEDKTASVDFSPSSTRIVTASSQTHVIVWDVATRQRFLGPFEHESYVSTVRYSPQGDRIATATSGSVRVYDGDDGRLLVNVPMHVSLLFYNHSLLWLKDQLLVYTSDKIVQLETSTGSIVLEWPIPVANNGLSIAVSNHGEFFAYSADEMVRFWDTSMPTQLGPGIQHTSLVGSMAFSPDDRFLVISDQGGLKIKTHDVSRGTISLLDVPDAALYSWKEDRLEDAEELLSRTIAKADRASHHVYANRALIRARLGRWDAAIEDAEKSIQVQPSVIGYISKSVALIGGGNKEDVSRIFDLAWRHVQSNDIVDALLLIKAVVLFMAGDYDEAMLRINILTDTLRSNSICYTVLAHMYLLLGDSHVKNNDYNRGIQSYELARAQIRSYSGSFLRTIALISGWKFDGLRITIRQRLCEALYEADRIKEAGDCLVELVNLFNEEVYVRGSVSQWVSDFIHRCTSAPEWAVDFKSQCVDTMVRFGDAAADAQQHDDAVIHYSAALSLGPPAPQDVFVKRSKASAAEGVWEDALNDANEVISLDPSSPWGYERKYVALGVAGRHKDKLDAFETALSKMALSDDEGIRERGELYPKTEKIIREVVQDAIQDLPPVLISITSGRLCDRSEQATAFELLPQHAEFISTMTTQMDMPLIRREVAEYYRYATFSHKNEANEPQFDEVVNTTVYELEESPTHHKLREFCRVVRDAGIHWGWSNTCCIDMSDHSMLQEAISSMFRWYHESTLTIIFLLDVCSPSQNGDLVKSAWNTRGWMFQEYHASKDVRFYNNDWTLYRNLDTPPSHKESPDIAPEIEEAAGMPAKVLSTLKPGLENIREKLYLGSKRETTHVEDEAYSLFGIFGVSLPVVYGEGDKALGHLLSQLLTKSGDTTILAWTGPSGRFNSCFPCNTTVFHELSPSHVQPDISESDVDEVAVGLRASSLNISFLTKLIDRLKELPAPWFAGQELKLPCLTFKVGRALLSGPDSGSERVFRVHSAVLGDVEIKTDEDLSRFESLYLVHPWIDFLLDRPIKSVRDAHEAESEYEGSVEEVLTFSTRPVTLVASLVQARASRFVARLKRFRRTRSESPPVPVSMEPPVLSQGSKQMKAARFAARLKQPFDVLLMAPDEHGGGKDDLKCRRVAADRRITVRVGEIAAPVLKQLVDGVRVLDVL